MRLRVIREFAMSRRILVHVAGANAWPCHPRALALGPAEAACCVRPSCRAPSLGPATEMVFCRPDLQGPHASVSVGAAARRKPYLGAAALPGSAPPRISGAEGHSGWPPQPVYALLSHTLTPLSTDRRPALLPLFV